AMQPVEPSIEPLPDPTCQILARRILEAFDFVEIVVIQLQTQRLERLGYLGVVHEPAFFDVHLAAHRDFAHKGMSVKTKALVTRVHARQPMRGLEPELLHKLNDHRSDLIRTSPQRANSRPVSHHRWLHHLTLVKLTRPCPAKKRIANQTQCALASRSSLLRVSTEGSRLQAVTRSGSARRSR